MVRHLSAHSSTRQWWHNRLEHYTPDGTFGRLLLATVTGPIGGLSLLLVLISVANLLWLPLVFALLCAGVGLTASLLTIVTLWPVYLSLIGNVESAKAYPQTAAPTPATENSDDPIAVVKRQYAAGNISETEFERRLDNLLHVDGESNGLGSRSHRERTRDSISEMD